MTKSELLEAGVTEPAVIEAMLRINPDSFPMPPKYGQNRTPELAAALMVQEVLRERPRSILEIGTGSGYVTALLRRAIEDAEIMSVERVGALAAAAVTNLTRFGSFEFGQAPLIVQHDDANEMLLSGRDLDVILLTAGTPSQWAESFLAYAPTVIGPIGDTPNDMALKKILRTSPPTVIHLCAVPGANPLKRGVE